MAEKNSLKVLDARGPGGRNLHDQEDDGQNLYRSWQSHLKRFCWAYLAPIIHIRHIPSFGMGYLTLCCQSVATFDSLSIHDYFMNVKHICFSSGVLINDTRLDIMDSVKGEPTTFCHNDLRVRNAQNVAFISIKNHCLQNSILCLHGRQHCYQCQIQALRFPIAFILRVSTGLQSLRRHPGAWY